MPTFLQTFVLRSRATLLGCFLFVFLLSGLIFTFTLPPFQVPDEHTHWWTQIERIQKTLSKENVPDRWNTLPLYFHAIDNVRFSRGWMTLSLISELKAIPATARGNLVVPYGGLLTYPNMLVTYLLLHRSNDSGFSALAGFYLARLLGGFLVLAMLMRVPAGKPFTLLLAACCVSPLFVQQSFAVSSDVVCNAFCICLITLWATWNQLKTVDLFCLAVLGLAACLTKPIYVVVAMTVFGFSAIHYQRAPRLERAPQSPAAMYGLAVLLVLLVTVAWINSQHALSNYPANASPAPSDVDVAGQYAWIKAHPWKTFRVVNEGFWYIVTYPAGYISPLGCLNFSLSRPTTVMWFLLFFCAAITEFIYGGVKSGGRRPYFKRFVGAGGLLLGGYAFGLLFSLGQYIFWASVGSDHSRGLQPRNLFGTFLLWMLAVYTLFSNVTVATVTESKQLGRGEQVALAVVGLACLLYLISLIGDILKRYWALSV